MGVKSAMNSVSWKRASSAAAATQAADGLGSKEATAQRAVARSGARKSCGAQVANWWSYILNGAYTFCVCTFGKWRAAWCRVGDVEAAENDLRRGIA